MSFQVRVDFTSYNNESVLHTLQSSRTGSSLSDAGKCHTQDTSFFGGRGLIPLK